MRTNRVVFAALLGLAGCATSDGTETRDLDLGPSNLVDFGRGVDSSNLQLWAVDRGGNTVDQNTFDQARMVYLSLSMADRGRAVVPGDLAFRVVDDNGTLMSKDVLDCRRFTVDGRGGITPNVGITRGCRGGAIQLADGRTLLSIVPVNSPAPDANGVRHYRLEATRLAAGETDDNARYTMSLPFMARSGDASSPVCGDGRVDAGEACDDGNTDDNDACHNDCSFCDGISDGHHAE